jgi:hypothetical protein
LKRLEQKNTTSANFGWWIASCNSATALRGSVASECPERNVFPYQAALGRPRGQASGSH